MTWWQEHVSHTGGVSWWQAVLVWPLVVGWMIFGGRRG